MEKSVLRIPTVKVMEEGKLQVRKQGREVNITYASRETIAESNRWSLRPADRNEADVNVCLSMDIVCEAVTKKAAGSTKASKWENSQGIQLKMPPTVPARLELAGKLDGPVATTAI